MKVIMTECFRRRRKTYREEQNLGLVCKCQARRGNVVEGQKERVMKLLGYQAGNKNVQKAVVIHSTSVHSPTITK